MVIHILQFLDGVVGVHLRRGEGAVAEHLFDGAEVRAVVEELRCERVAQHVRRTPSGDTIHAAELPLDEPVHEHGIEPASPGRDEKGNIALVCFAGGKGASLLGAGNAMKLAGPYLQGNGGGRPEMASGSCKDLTRFEEALKELKSKL